MGGIYVYSESSMLLFFLVVLIKKKYGFKTMEAYAKEHYSSFGWQQAPSRPTIRRRFQQMPQILKWLIPEIALYGSELDERFRYTFGFIDKSIFQAKGWLWHKKYQKQGIIPHPSIDTDASWGKSPYHGWRFGYGLHLIVNELRFPISAWVTTASIKDYKLIDQLTKWVKSQMLVLVGDSGYRAIRTIWNTWNDYQVFVLTNTFFETSSKLKDWYNAKLKKMNFNWLYAKRKPSVEPTFSLIKELFDLQNKRPLPYRGKTKVSAFLMICTFSLQLIFIFNSVENHPIGKLSKFKALF